MWGEPFTGLMSFWGGGWGWPFMGIVPLLLLILLIAAIAGLVRSSSGTKPSARPRSPGLDALEERYARNEIGRDEFLQKKKDLVG
ncbi:MAG: SHOCT domain-containing protein [Devosia nanyangense]|uniref:SHOCT domain-containing protein n=1 Tax=Devosia nanyangense TaxID=1228055 RepID=A0A933L644_9HYPH|nr:SHOCT domain-containing protein [Devosia nanyangense]